MKDFTNDVKIYTVVYHHIRYNAKWYLKIFWLWAITKMTNSEAEANLDIWNLTQTYVKCKTWHGRRKIQNYNSTVLKIFLKCEHKNSKQNLEHINGLFYEPKRIFSVSVKYEVCPECLKPHTACILLKEKYIMNSLEFLLVWIWEMFLAEGPLFKMRSVDCW